MNYSELEPKKVYKFFGEIAAIPHGSGNTAAIAGYLMNFAKERNLEAVYDKGGNVIIFKKGTSGYENSEPVILQGHMDMVCDKVPHCEYDMEKEGLHLHTDGEFLWADKTTLGGDDGIAVAYILAILDSDDIPHPPIEALITRDEETGMLGANELEAHYLKGTRMINIDSEDEGIFTAGCAGGMRVHANIPVTRKGTVRETLLVEIGGLKGGHSGIDIGKNRVNAIQLLAEILYCASSKFSFHLCSINGGVKDNVIPKEASAVIVGGNIPSLSKAILAAADDIRRKIPDSEPDFVINVSPKGADSFITSKSTKLVIETLCKLPTGVLEYSSSNEILTSLNMGTVSLDDSSLKIGFLTRSNLRNGNDSTALIIEHMVSEAGGTCTQSSSYPAWEYAEKSPLRNLMTDAFQEIYGKYPKIETIHAGLECGIIADKIPGLDAVSIGPDLTDIHTPNERLNIASAKRTWEFLLEALKKLK